MKSYKELTEQIELEEGKNLIKKYKMDKTINGWAKDKADELMEFMHQDAWIDNTGLDWEDVDDEDAEQIYEDIQEAMWKALVKAMAKV